MRKIDADKLREELKEWLDNAKPTSWEAEDSKRVKRFACEIIREAIRTVDEQEDVE